MSHAEAIAPPSRLFVVLTLLWLAGACLRLTVLAVPPVVPRLHADLGLSETEIGVLTSLPALLFAAAAVPSSLLIARLGAIRTLILGLLVNAAGSALRGAAPNAFFLDVTTFVTALGIALMQPAMPPLVRAWLPQRIGFASAFYTNGLLVGEIIVVGSTIPLILPMLGGSWRLSFVFWSLPVLATAALFVALAPRSSRPAGSAAAAPRRWWPDWRRPFLWRLGLILGSINSLYFVTNHFLPDYLTLTGRPDLIGPSLVSLNAAQLPASFLMLVFAGRLVLRRRAYVACGGAALISVAGLTLMPGAWVVFWAGVLGFLCALVLTLAFAVPALVSAPDDVHRTSAGMFTISYSMSVLTPIVGGLLWDLTQLPIIGFLPIALCAVIVTVTAATTDFRAEARAAGH
jgi:CP family cyanate transporter-like MFS transporter